MAWDRPVLTDSGGFQVFSLGTQRKVDDDGVTFRSIHDGSIHRFTPERVIEIEEMLGADIIMPLDECIALPATDRRFRRALDRTHRWLERAVLAKRRSDQAFLASCKEGRTRLCAAPGRSSSRRSICRATRLAASVWVSRKTEMYDALAATTPFFPLQSHAT